MQPENDFLGEKIRLINYAISETESAYHDVAQLLSISDSELSILYVLRYEGKSIKLKDLVALTGACKQTINSAVRKMEKAGSITLTPADGKNKLVSLTEKGEALAERTADKLIETERLVFSGWSKKDVDEYLRLSEKYLREFKNEIKNIKTRKNDL